MALRGEFNSHPLVYMVVVAASLTVAGACIVYVLL